jgi:pSer/pThr/pTyr-binding forkhead associated (FHA) protein
MSLQAHGELVPNGGGDPIPLIRDRLTIGRRESCDIPLQFPNVSGLHAELSFRSGYWHIRDKGSTNGIKVNGVRVQEKYLHPGDEITIAKRTYKISYELQAGRKALEEMEDEDILSVPLMEKAGLVRPERDREERHKNFDPGEFLLDDDDGRTR